jgi:predicted metal-dependent hydrolase
MSPKLSQPPGNLLGMQVEVVRSPRRNRTVALRPVPGGVRISIPAWSTKAEEDHYVETLLRQYERSQKKTDVSLVDRARSLAKRFGLQEPASIQWANQKTRWGSCNTANGAIRISSDVRSFPGWVLDYVIVHELAHLSYLGHGPRFWALCERYSKTERARGFLLAKGLEASEETSDNQEDRQDEGDVLDLIEPKQIVAEDDFHVEPQQKMFS